MADILLFDSRFSSKELIGAAIITFFNILTIIERGKVEEERKSQILKAQYTMSVSYTHLTLPTILRV